MLDRQALLHKTKNTTTHDHNESSEDLSDFSSEDEAATKVNAAKKIRKELESSESSENESGSDSE